MKEGEECRCVSSLDRWNEIRNGSGLGLELDARSTLGCWNEEQTSCGCDMNLKWPLPQCRLRSEVG